MFSYHPQQWLVFFFLYCFLGWMFESILVSVVQKRPINRGFLYGPALPIYGFGAIAILFATLPVRNNLPLVFLFGTASATVLELCTGYAMESLFKVRYWDYSNARFNFHGYISLKSSVLWGILSLFLVHFLQSKLEALVLPLDMHLITDLNFGLVSFFLFDLYVSVRKAFDLRKLLEQSELLQKEALLLQLRIESLQGNVAYGAGNIRQAAGSAAGNARRLASEILSDNQARLNALRSMALDRIPEGTAKEIEGRISSLQSDVESWYARARLDFSDLIGDHPYLSSRFYKEAFSAAVRTVQPAVQKAAEAGKNVFVLKDASATGYLWIFLSASVLGSLAETLFFFATHGTFEPRTAAVFGLLNPIYGCSALLLCILLDRRNIKGLLPVFLWGIFTGCMVQYAASFLQQEILGSLSWDYSAVPLNINGRICFPYALFWGGAALIWIKIVYPFLYHFLFSCISHRAGKIVVSILLLLFAADEALTFGAVIRWNRRDSGIPALTQIEHRLDQWFPDDTLSRIFPTMDFSVSHSRTD